MVSIQFSHTSASVLGPHCGLFTVCAIGFEAMTVFSELHKLPEDSCLSPPYDK